MNVYLFSAIAAQTLPLHDIVDDYEASWWPLAPGWWLLMVLLAALLGTATWLGWRRWQHQRGKKRIEQLLQAPVSRISDVTLRLKQILLLKYPRSQLTQQFESRLLASVSTAERAALSAALQCHLAQQFQDHDRADAEAFQRWALTWWQYASCQFKQEVRHV